MLFFLVRIFPVIIPLVYFALVRALLAYPERWAIWLTAALFVNAIYFILLRIKVARKRIWFTFLYVEAFTVLGMVYMALLSNKLFIDIVLVIWTIVYWLYLEATFNYYYRTKKIYLIELKNITSSVNIALFFILSFVLIYFFTFLGLSWSWVLAIYFLTSFVLLFVRFLTSEIDHGKNYVYSLAIALVLTEFVAALLWWPISGYVLSVTIALLYYVLSSLSQIYLEGELHRSTVLKYGAFATLIMVVMLVTAQWI